MPTDCEAISAARYGAEQRPTRALYGPGEFVLSPFAVGPWRPDRSGAVVRVAARPALCVLHALTGLLFLSIPLVTRDNSLAGTGRYEFGIIDGKYVHRIRY